jgi:hypothetical protein
MSLTMRERRPGVLEEMREPGESPVSQLYLDSIEKCRQRQLSREEKTELNNRQVSSKEETRRGVILTLHTNYCPLDLMLLCPRPCHLGQRDGGGGTFSSFCERRLAPLDFVCPPDRKMSSAGFSSETCGKKETTRGGG